MSNLKELVTRYVLSLGKTQAKLESEINESVLSLNLDKDLTSSLALIADEVEQNGYFIIEKALSEESLNALRKEYENFFEADKEKFYGEDSKDGSVCIRVKPFWQYKYTKEFPVTLSVFNVKPFQKITEFFYKTHLKNINYISEIFVHNTPETNEPISGGLHWDRAQTLKFWIYLNDLGIENGPMRIEPGSSKRNAELRRSSGDPNKLIGQIDNIVDSEVEEVYLTAPAGSIMIHDTDASHGASPVSQGKERQIMRGHCRKTA